jgi:hypothetical protein
LHIVVEGRRRAYVTKTRLAVIPDWDKELLKELEQAGGTVYHQCGSEIGEYDDHCTTWGMRQATGGEVV